LMIERNNKFGMPFSEFNRSLVNFEPDKTNLTRLSWIYDKLLWMRCQKRLAI
jgi:hypothetical protein